METKKSKPLLQSANQFVRSDFSLFHFILLTLLVKHTSASLLIQENADPEVKFDFIQYLEKLVPPSSSPEMSYLTHTYEGPDDMPAHIKSGLLPTTLSIPVVNGKMTLGTWQGIYLVEHRASPRKREIAASLLLA